MNRIQAYATKVQLLKPPGAVERLRQYAVKVAKSRNVPPEAAKRIAQFGHQVRPLIAADARERWRMLEAMVGVHRLRDGFVPSVLELSAAEIGDETRFSLMLAGLLDPVRSGPIAERFWTLLLAKLEVTANPERRQRLQERRLHWSAELLSQIEVDPLSHAAEWNNLDVFARVEGDGALRFALVIENKVRADTEEQDRQLVRYYEKIATTFGDGINRTIFVFLTEAPREMKTAEYTELEWHPLLWADVEQILAEIGHDESLTSGWHGLVFACRDAIRREILGKNSMASLRAMLMRLGNHVSKAHTDQDWVHLHSDILTAHLQLQEYK